MYPYTPKRQSHCLWCLSKLENQDFSFLTRHDFLCNEHEQLTKTKRKQVFINHRIVHYYHEYNHHIASLLFRYKEHKDIPLCGCMFYPYRKDLRMMMKNHSLVMVPSSIKKTLERGFHPLELTLKICGFEVVDVLIKQSEEDQKTKGKKQRKQTMFALTSNHQTMRKQVLLIDDVLTTGHSLMQCWDLLEIKGYRVKAVVLSIHSSWL
jgi:competence protein ComFC